MVQHGSALFPIACYAENLKSYSVAWHWHEEFEYILAMKGPLTVDVNKTRVTLHDESGRVPELRQSSTRWSRRKRGGPCFTRVWFHPRLVGGMDTIFWQKLIRPMLQPDAPAFFCWMRLCPGRRRCLPACGKPGRRLPWSPLITRTGCVTISLRRCGC